MDKVKLDKLVSISKGKKLEESNTKKDSLRYIQIEDLRGDGNIKHTKRIEKMVVANTNDILIAWDGANAGTIGFGLEGAIGSTIAKLSPRFEFHTPYVGRYLQSKSKELREKCTGATIPHISKSYLNSLAIPFPSLAKQKRIATILDKADALRQKNKQLLAAYDELLQSTFLDMFGDPLTNPKELRKKYLGELTNLVTDGKHGDCKNEENSGYFFISAKDIHDGIIDYTNARQINKTEFEEVHRRTNLMPEDIVLVNTGATIGKAAIVENSIHTRKTTFQKSVAVVKTKKEVLNPYFLIGVFGIRIKELAKSSTGSAVHNLLLSQIRKFEIPIPPIEKQNNYAQIVKNIEAQKAVVKQSLLESEDLFNGLVQKAFKGELNGQ